MQSLFQASIINTFSGIASMAAGFGSTVLVARLLGAEGTGLTAFALWLVFSAYALADRGIPATVLRYVGQRNGKENTEQDLVRQLYPKFIWPVLLLTVAFAAYSFWHSDNPVDGSTGFWLVTSLLFVTYCHSQLAIAADHGRGDYVGPATKVVIGCLLQLPVIAVGAYYFGAAGAMAGHFARHVPQSLAIVRHLKHGSSLDTPVNKQIIRYSRNSWISSTLTVLVRTRVEFIFIGVFFSLTEVGYFAAAITFSSLIFQLALAMTAGLSARFARLREAGELERMGNTYQRALRWMALLLFPVSFGGAAVIQEILPMVGDEFRPAVATASVLIALAFAQCLVSLPLSMMLAHERDKTVMIMNAVSAAVLLVLNLAIIPSFSGFGAAWVKSIVAFAGFSWALWYCQTRLGLVPGIRSLFGLAASAGTCAGVAWLVLVEVQGLPGLLSAIAAGALIYLLGIRLTGAMLPDDVDSLRTTLRKILPAAMVKPAIWIVSQLAVRRV
ncbi:polysaccharide biosynthesis C-terminal domain-containing protein [Roseibium salinum]|uniref:oligosaccharide flippase family protein n=1 Tax=Roseibium salinum TaxID=1604349 RepID=UPI00360E44C3